MVTTPGGGRAGEGNVGAPVDPAVTTSVVEFNDLDALNASWRRRRRRAC